MTEQDWQRFLQAPGLEDWRTLFSGPCAHFRTTSLAHGASLVSAIAALDGIDRHPPAIDLRPGGVTVRLARDIEDVSDHDVVMARRISEVARELGAPAEATRLQHIQVAVASHPEAGIRPFWQAVLGYERVGREDFVDPQRRGPSFWVQDLDGHQALQHAFHIDIAVPAEVGEARVAAALAAGGRIADDRRAPDWWTLADAAGNKVDVATWPDRIE
ncbi:VOC family protein [Agromyces sp. NPDC056523]|uniref:4a-hydroxytetrahydrobiopterin dehydratase n=1 Tax=Agromyces sp. NPDC056523 TaxID=3345850 RepID=UPI00366E72DD